MWKGANDVALPFDMSKKNRLHAANPRDLILTESKGDGDYFQLTVSAHLNPRSELSKGADLNRNVNLTV